MALFGQLVLPEQEEGKREREEVEGVLEVEEGRETFKKDQEDERMCSLFFVNVCDIKVWNTLILLEEIQFLCKHCFDHHCHHHQ